MLGRKIRTYIHCTVMYNSRFIQTFQLIIEQRKTTLEKNVAKHNMLGCAISAPFVTRVTLWWGNGWFLKRSMDYELLNSRFLFFDILKSHLWSKWYWTKGQAYTAIQHKLLKPKQFSQETKTWQSDCLGHGHIFWNSSHKISFIFGILLKWTWTTLGLLTNWVFLLLIQIAPQDRATSNSSEALESLFKYLPLRGFFCLSGNLLA